MNKILITCFVAIFFWGCKSKDDVLLSPLFNICAKLDSRNESYLLNREPVVDWDDGYMRLGDAGIDVYVGRHPDFSGSKDSIEKIGYKNFFLLGKGRRNGKEQVLLAKKVSNVGGDFIYVMFTEKENHIDLNRILQQDFLYECKRNH